MDLISKVIIITLATFLAALFGVQPVVVYEQVIPADYEQLKIDKANLENNLTAAQSQLATAQEALRQIEQSRMNGVIVPRNWESREEIRQFLNETDIETNPYITKTYDCEDFALDLQQAALRWKDGLFLGMYIEKQDGGIFHMKNIAIAGNRIYLVEPQSDSITHFCNLD